MIPIEPEVIPEGTKLVVYAKNQPEYIPLPVIKYPDGLLLTEWKLTEEEREAIIRGENIKLWIWTFNNPLQPIALEVTKETE